MTIVDLPVYLQAIAVFLSNFGFLYFRTLNVYHNGKLNRLGVFWTGAVVHILWLLAISIGVSAVIEGNYLLILFSAAGGLLGADRALLNKIKKNNISSS